MLSFKSPISKASKSLLIYSKSLKFLFFPDLTLALGILRVLSQGSKFSQSFHISLSRMPQQLPNTQRTKVFAVTNGLQ